MIGTIDQRRTVLRSSFVHLSIYKLRKYIFNSSLNYFEDQKSKSTQRVRSNGKLGQKKFLTRETKTKTIK